MSRRFELIVVLALLLLAAFIRIHALARLPVGFDDEEISNLHITDTARTGQIAVFYNMGTPGYRARESLFPILEAVITGFIGDGLLSYRLLPMWGGLLSVALAYALGRQLIGSFEGLIAGSLMVVGLWPVLLARSVLAESLLLPLTLGALLLLARALHLHRTVRPLPPHTIPYALLALLMVFAIYDHWTGLMLAPLIAVFLIYLRITRQPISRRVYGYSAFALLLALILGIPYLTSAIRIPSLSGFGAFWLQRPPTLWALLGNLFNLVISLFGLGSLGVFGLLLSLPLAALLIAGIVTARRRWRTPGYMLALSALIAGVLPAIWVGRGDFLLTMALPAAAILIGSGVKTFMEWTRRAVDPPQRRALLSLLPLLGVGLLMGLQTEFFDRWATDPHISQQYHGMLGGLTGYLNMVHDDLPTLVCTPSLASTAEQPVSDIALIEMMIHRPQSNLRFSDCQSALVLADGGRMQRVVFSSPDQQTPPALRGWLPANARAVHLPGTSGVFIYQFDVERELADAVGKLTLSHVEWPPDAPNARDPVQLPVRMGDYLNFEGYSLGGKTEYKPGDVIHLVTYWRIDGAQSSDLRLFTHVLLDPGSQPVAQTDALDVAPAYLQNRDIVIQFSTIQIPYPFPDGVYYLSVGAYHDTTKARVPVYDEHDQLRGDRLFLDTITIKG